MPFSLAARSAMAIAFGLPADTASPSTPRWIMSCAIWTSWASLYSCGPMNLHSTLRSLAAWAQPCCSGGVKALFSTLKTIAMVLASALAESAHKASAATAMAARGRFNLMAFLQC